jgi:hypothetical protein
MIPYLLGMCPWEMMYSKKTPKMSDMVFITKPDRITVNSWLSEVPEDHHFTIIS